MARPRLVRLEQGEVSLSGFPAEVAEALSQHIKSFGQEPSLELAVGQATVDPFINSISIAPLEHVSEDTTLLPNKSLGISVDPATSKLSLVVVGYDLATHKARVEEIQVADGMRDAIVKFKMKAVELHLIY